MPNSYDDALAQRKYAESQAIQDSAIYEKMTKPKVDQFEERMPTQVAHCLRLVLERLQLGMDKRSRIQITNEEVAQLSRAALDLYNIHVEVKWQTYYTL